MFGCHFLESIKKKNNNFFCHYFSLFYNFLTFMNFFTLESATFMNFNHKVCFSLLSSQTLNSFFFSAFLFLFFLFLCFHLRPQTLFLTPEKNMGKTSHGYLGPGCNGVKAWRSDRWQRLAA